ncbi:hypothetical protein MtrunA17_Chr8g0337161 [Medicago truncatula]|uniref:Uncharacterized protein n=1 Tax=Medicago truncatula TaxID=3880 RepID=A0A396GE18_MEDTR|nr:hypothetical protein MtrunA17_Chr8g0337161 [Medicago truncatula]
MANLLRRGLQGAKHSRKNEEINTNGAVNTRDTNNPNTQNKTK